MRMYGHDGKAFRNLFCSCVHLYTLILVLCTCLVCGISTPKQTTSSLIEATEHLFYHGYDNYLRYAFPEDEIKPLSCAPHTRDRENPGHFEVNDALGNYSLTLIDSLSTLAVLASNSPGVSAPNKALGLFQDGIKLLVEHYGDGTNTTSGKGTRADGFDLDSKVQVFETVIRGVGGLLSAHLFAVGDLPIRGYRPDKKETEWARNWHKVPGSHTGTGIRWSNGLTYDGQLLRLAHDLASRLVPAFWTSTGIPYPRVNLKHGIPFYANSPHNFDPNEGQCTAENTKPAETTETCSAGAGSLVLEFAVLSRLTGDSRFEDLAKRAFWAIWARRSKIDLIGAGIDAETGEWIGHYTGIGAGIDSFFEYAFKAYVLLQQDVHPKYAGADPSKHPGSLFGPLPDDHQRPEAFHEAWETAHTAIKRHLSRASNFQHPHYIQADLRTGAGRAYWIDSLSAYYTGLLALSGHVEEATESHLLTTALWTRFSALPERYNLVTGGVEGGLGWWPGRPEFIESNYYLYRATEDPWYKHVAEMTLRDIERRCWAKCGWAGIQNVLTGEKSDRMESFFLGETAKYLFLTFNEEHPLNHLDAPFVFSTEGHPLIIPKSCGNYTGGGRTSPVFQPRVNTCPAKIPPLPLSVSVTASRGDLYHAASLARLHQMPQMELDASNNDGQHLKLHTSNDTLATNFTFYPWTLPLAMLPANATSQPMRTQPTFELTFPNMQASGNPETPLQKAIDGIQVNSLSGLRLSLIKDVPIIEDGLLTNGYRVQSINSFGLGKDEKVYLLRDRSFGTVDPADPNFTKLRDSQMLDLILDPGRLSSLRGLNTTAAEEMINMVTEDPTALENVKATWGSIVSQLAHMIQESHNLNSPFVASEKDAGPEENTPRIAFPAIVPTGIGAAPIPDWPEADALIQPDQSLKPLLWKTVYAADELCDNKLPRSVPREHHVIVIKRGGCSFSTKLSNIPSYAPSSQSLQLVVLVNYGSEGDNDNAAEQTLFRPLLDQVQLSSGGLRRANPLPMVMIGGGEQSYRSLQYARGLGIKRRHTIRTQGVLITNLVVV